MFRAIQKLWVDEEGTASVEYALLLVVVVVASIGAWTGLRDRVVDAIVEAQASLTP